MHVGEMVLGQEYKENPVSESPIREIGFKASTRFEEFWS